MRAVAVEDDGHLRVVERPDPAPGTGQVVVAVERCGICGTDLHLRESGVIPAGAILGHEFAGPVVNVGEAAGEGLAVGQRVAVLPAHRCGTCPRCRSGNDHLCPEQAMTAVGLGINDGAFAELVRVPASSCHPLPDDMTSEQGALVEPYAVALHAIGRSRVLTAAEPSVGAQVGIIGAGPIGLLCLAALRWAGVEHVAVAETREARRRVAAALGATVVPAAGRLRGALGRPLDVVFEAAGTSATPVSALEVVRPGGEVILVGTLPPGAAVPMPGLLWVVKEVDVRPAMAYTRAEFAAAVSQLAAGAVDVDLLVADVRPLEAADRSFEELAGPRVGGKIMLAPRP